MRRSASVHSALDERAGGRPRSSSMASPMTYGNVNHQDSNTTNTTTRSQRLPGEVDDGLSMMTSALLTMLDTPPEEATAQQQQQQVQNYEIDEQQTVTSSRLDNRYYTRASSNRATAPSEDSSREYHNNPSTYYTQSTFLGQNTTTEDRTLDSSMSMSMPMLMPTTTHSSLNFLGGQPEGHAIVNQIGRIQSWQGSAAAGVIHENAQFSSIINPTQQPSSSPSTSANVGLYY